MSKRGDGREREARLKHNNACVNESWNGMAIVYQCTRPQPYARRPSPAEPDESPRNMNAGRAVSTRTEQSYALRAHANIDDRQPAGTAKSVISARESETIINVLQGKGWSEPSERWSQQTQSCISQSCSLMPTQWW